MVRNFNIQLNLATALACDPNHLRLGMARLTEGLVIRSLIERLELRTFEVVSMKPEGLRVNNCQGAGIGKLLKEKSSKKITKKKETETRITKIKNELELP